MEDVLNWYAKEFIQNVIIYAPWLVVSALVAGSGYVLGALVFGRRYKERIARLEEEVRKRQESPAPDANHADLGYEVLTWWDEPDNVFDEIKAAASLRKRFPRAIRDKRTGEVHEVPHPRR